VGAALFNVLGAILSAASARKNTEDSN